SIFRGFPRTAGVWWPADGMGRRAHSVASELVLPLYPQLRRGHHSPDRPDQGAVLPAHAQEHALDEGHAGAAATDQLSPLQAQERSAASEAREHVAIPRASGHYDLRLTPAVSN